MLEKSIPLSLCAALLGLGACAHDAKPRERASVSAVTHEEVSDNAADPGKTRMHYTEVSNRESLGRDRDPSRESDLKEGERLPPAEANASGTAGDSNACELAVYFESDSAQLNRGSQERLDRVAECMKRREIDHAVIMGQTDPSGSAAHNDQLGLERARVVAEYLRGRGVPEEQIRVRSKGEVASAESRALWPVERRAGIDVKK